MDTMQKVLRMTDVHDIVDHLSDVLQRAVIIEDKNFELVAYSSPDELSFDALQQKSILTKRCPLFVIERLKTEGIVSKLQHDNHPLRIDIEEINFYKRIAISLKQDEELYGYLWVYETEDTLEESYLDELQQIAPHLGKLMHSKQQEVEKDQQTFIWQLLNHEFLGATEIQREAKAVGYEIPEEFTVIAISVRGASFLSILGKAKKLFIEEKIAYYLGKGTEIIGVVHSDNEQKSLVKTRKLQEKLMTMLSDEEKGALFIGIGNEYSQIKQVRKSYLEALEVIETMDFLNVKQQTTFFFYELGMYRYIKIMYKKNVNEQYRNEKIVKMMKRDVENNSELLLTLGTYLKNDCKVAQTAEELFIHPNTLSYRLKQIQELTAIDFTNMDEKTELYTHLLILQLIPDYKAFYEQLI
ncbi:MAG TPA: helix-turn-helix domain-containing protein [Pseudogracilibacillus sp.]|nr:helix-turn-helix domain-containing protein [Pseudogracilibacillus sp.]